jgi:transposase
VALKWDEQALEAAARHEHDARVRCRLLALRQLALGRTVAQTAGPFMLGPSQLYHWIRRFDAEGLAGLKDRPRSGAPQRLARASEEVFVQRVLDGPGPDSGLAAWRGEDLRGVLREAFGAEYSLSGVYALLHRLGLSNLVPRPQHPRSDEAAQAAFKKSARH